MFCTCGDFENEIDGAAESTHADSDGIIRTKNNLKMGESSVQRYKRLRYREGTATTSSSTTSAPRRPSSPTSTTSNAATSSSNAATSKAKRGKLRVYRLNLERPFDILNEQSPLEYGDYMKIWNEKDYPPTVGPVEYMPPRHLGGNAQVWRTLMQYGRIAREDGELQQQEGASNSNSHNNIIESIVHDPDDEEDVNASFALDNSDNPLPLSYSNWRVLTPDEIKAHQQLGETDPQTGEYTFRTYDLSHVVERRYRNLSIKELSIHEEEDAVQEFDADADEYDADAVDSPTPSPTSTAMELVTVLSTESTGSEDERTNFKTEEEMADMTARLFRRSEISLREKAEADARKAQEEKRRKEEEERARKAEEKRIEMEERAKALQEGRKYKRSSTTGSMRKGSGKFSSKIKRSLSTISNKLTNELGGSSHDVYSRSGSGVCMNPKFRKSSSTQASAIEKARDLIDNEDEVEEGVDAENKKPLNLYIYGEYDVLNDLVNDGAKRLAKSKNMSDLDLLLQNDPCPPPDRWVRPTGWSRCNPSSCYAANPPKDYDLNSYGTNKVKLPHLENEGINTANPNPSKPHPLSATEKLNPKDSNATQTTAAVSGSNSEDLFDVTTSNHRHRGAATKPSGGGVVNKVPSSPVPHLKTLPTESCGTPQGVYPTGVSASAAASSATKSPARLVRGSSTGSAKNRSSIGKKITRILKS